MTKRQQGMLFAYNNTPSWKNTLLHVYKQPSRAKKDAYDYCFCEYKAFNGYVFKVIGVNCFHFSCAYKYDVVNVQTGEIETHLRYHTYCNVYDFPIFWDGNDDPDEYV